MVRVSSGDPEKRRKKKKRVTSGGSEVSVESYFETGADGKIKVKVSGADGKIKVKVCNDLAM